MSGYLLTALRTSRPLCLTAGPSRGRGRSLLVLAVVGGLFLSRLTYGTAADEEPETKPLVIAGRTVAEWQARLSDFDITQSEIVAEVPGLMAVVDDQRVPWFTRRRAALTLGRMGRDARSAIPLLLRLSHPEISSSKTSAEGDASEEPTERWWAIQALGRFGPAAVETLPILFSDLANPETEANLRLALLEAVSQIGREDSRVIGALVRIVQGQQPSITAEVRIAAIEALGMAGGGSGPAVPSLIGTLNDPDDATRFAAVVTLGKLGSAAEVAQLALYERLLVETQEPIREAVITALGQLGPGDTSLIERWCLAESSAERLIGLRIIAGWGRRARSVRLAGQRLSEWLIERSDAADPLEAIVATEVCWTLYQDLDAMTSRLFRGLMSSDRESRLRANRLLLRWGERGESLRSQLAAGLTDHDPQRRSAAAQALRTLDRGTSVGPRP